MWGFLAKILGSGIGTWLSEIFQGRRQRRIGAQEAASKRLEKSHEQAKERVEIENESERLSRDELLRDPDLVRNTRPDDE